MSNIIEQIYESGFAVISSPQGSHVPITVYDLELYFSGHIDPEMSEILHAAKETHPEIVEYGHLKELGDAVFRGYQAQGSVESFVLGVPCFVEALIFFLHNGSYVPTYSSIFGLIDKIGMSAEGQFQIQNALGDCETLYRKNVCDSLGEASDEMNRSLRESKFFKGLIPKSLRKYEVPKGDTDDDTFAFHLYTLKCDKILSEKPTPQTKAAHHLTIGEFSDIARTNLNEEPSNFNGGVVALIQEWSVERGREIARCYIDELFPRDEILGHIARLRFFSDAPTNAVSYFAAQVAISVLSELPGQSPNSNNAFLGYLEEMKQDILSERRLGQLLNAHPDVLEDIALLLHGSGQNIQGNILAALKKFRSQFARIATEELNTDGRDPPPLSDLRPGP